MIALAYSQQLLPHLGTCLSTIYICICICIISPTSVPFRSRAARINQQCASATTFLHRHPPREGPDSRQVPYEIAPSVFVPTLDYSISLISPLHCYTIHSPLYILCDTKKDIYIRHFAPDDSDERRTYWTSDPDSLSSSSVDDDGSPLDPVEIGSCTVHRKVRR